MKKVTFTLFALLILCTFSCKKEETLSKNMQLLTNGSWVQSNYSIYGDSFWDDVPECVKDNIHTFYTNNIFIEDEGSTKCEDTDSQSIKYIWSFYNNESKIYDGEDTLTILKLNEDQFIFQFEFDGDIIVVENNKL